MPDLLSGLKAVAESTRLRLLLLLNAAELTVTELTQILGQSQPRLSRHLKLMAQAGLIERHREGAWVFHRAVREGLGGRLNAAVLDLVDPDEPDGARDRAVLSRVMQERSAAAARYFAANAAEWDRIRSLHIPETDVEARLDALVGPGPFDLLCDIGTGTGRMLELFAPRARRALGIDQSQEMLAVARARLDAAGLAQAQVRLGDMYRLPLAEGQADLVILHQVLHFATDAAAVVAEAARVLRPGGVMLVVDFLPHEHEELRERYAHRRLGFSPREVEAWGRAAHLDVNLAARLDGGPLTVGIWRAAAPVARPLEYQQSRAIQ